MISVKIQTEAVEHLAAQGSLDLETAEQVLQECLSLCEIREIPQTDGVGELIRAAATLLKLRPRLLTICLPYREECAQLAGALHGIAMALEIIQQGSAQTPPTSETNECSK